MSKIAKVFSTTWQTIDGVLSAVFVARDSIRREISIAVPAMAFSFLAGDARRRITAATNKGQLVKLLPPYLSVNFLTVQTMTVGTTDTQTVGIIFDRDLDTEFGLSLPLEHARELGQQLIAETEKISKNPQHKH
jgi:hypothetical protein